MTGPALTVVVLAGPLRSRAERVLEALARQSARGRLEVVVVDAADGAAPLRVPQGLEVRTIHVQPGAGFGALRLAGLQAGQAPLVAFLDDHCRPDPGWAEAVIAAFDGPWAVVGYAFRIANPEAWWSRVDAVAECGQWLAPVRSGPRLLVAGSNIAYRRSAVERLPALGELLDVDFNLQRALLATGERLYLAGDAVAAHEHPPRLIDALRACSLYCELLAQRRSRGWRMPRRLLYAALVPAVAPVRRIQGLLSARPDNPGLARRLVAALPGVLLIHLVAALGEARGYLRPRSDLPARFARLELTTVRAPVPTPSRGEAVGTVAA